MERTVSLKLAPWNATRRQLRIGRSQLRTRLFAGLLIACALLSAGLSSWLPLQFSVVTVFLFAGPHNLVEFRYFVMRLPARFGKSRDFFMVAFGGIFLLTSAYLSLPALFYAGVWSGKDWPTMIGVWNTLLLLWLATLVWMRGRQRRGRDWAWAWPVAFTLISMNWLAPELFSLALVYLHPLVALWFLERQLRRSRPEWLGAYHRCLALLPLLIAAMCWQLSSTTSLAQDNGLAWRITQHAGAELLPRVSSHLLVSLHVFLEMLHYLVWLLVLPILGATGGFLSLKTLPLVRHPRGFPNLIAAAIVVAIFMVGLLWVGFAVDYPATRDLYFAVAIAHVLAEAPFLLRTI